MKKRKRSFGRRIGRFILYAFLASILYTLICRFIWPPVTITQLSAMIQGHGLKRDYVPLDEISLHVKLAALASEDQLFPDHEGFDWKAIDKSLNGKQSKKKKKRPRGSAASTISQQTAKNVFLWQGSGWSRYVRKVPEAYFTKLIEWTWGKKRILEVYLNVIEMGPGIFGIEAAAQKYFHKSARNLTRAEAAKIIACLPNPKKYTVVPESRMVSRRTPHILRHMNNLAGDPDVQRIVK
jgi:monofunctional biosynthetic peptidoglycan transglycosylase